MRLVILVSAGAGEGNRAGPFRGRKCRTITIKTTTGTTGTTTTSTATISIR
jgi:hypothetical protein